MKRTIELSLETAINFYKKGGEFRELALSAYTEEELTMAQLPKSWEEYYNSLCKDLRALIDLQLTGTILPHKYIALMKLELLRDCYRKMDGPQKMTCFCINRCSDGFRIVELNPHSYQHFLSFRVYETAETFRNNFDKLLKEAGDLI